MSQTFAISELVQGTGGRAVGVPAGSDPRGRIVTDSRTVEPGDVFWALVGERHDGHDFAEIAVERGVAACVLERESVADGPRVLVRNTRSALLDFAADHRSHCRATVVGVTGSVGKTTTREAIHAVLSRDFTGVRSPKNFNNDVGVPLTLLSLNRLFDYAVVELAASAVGEIARLCDVARPEIGVVTAVAPAHLAGFGSLEHITTAKAELPSALPARGFAVLNGDDPRVESMRHVTRARVVTIGSSHDCTIRGHVTHVEPERFRFRAEGHAYSMRASGRHHLTAGLAAVAIGLEFGMTPDVIADGLERFTPIAGRSHVERVGDWTVIDDGYNASPASVQAACRLLGEWPEPATRILVLGDMAELGDEAAAHHEAIGTAAAEADVDHLLAHGAHAERVVHGSHAAGMEAHRSAVCGDLEELLAELWSRLEPGAVVLVKGSRSTRMERVVERLRRWAGEHVTAVEHAVPAPLSA